MTVAPEFLNSSVIFLFPKPEITVGIVATECNVKYNLMSILDPEVAGFRWQDGLHSHRDNRVIGTIKQSDTQRPMLSTD